MSVVQAPAEEFAGPSQRGASGLPARSLASRILCGFFEAQASATSVSRISTESGADGGGAEKALGDTAGPVPQA
ncbi:MAG: hypothetical protein NT180_00340 [Actinobacteria bacterium]|nr:hypothetical protein [Actinomycetota bacterium]